MATIGAQLLAWRQAQRYTAQQGAHVFGVSLRKYYRMEQEADAAVPEAVERILELRAAVEALYNELKQWRSGEKRL